MSLSRFAHLLGVKAKASEDEEDKKVKKAEEEEKEDEQDEQEEQGEEEEEPKSKKSKAEDEQDEPEAEEDDTSDDDDEKESPDAKKARVAENKRCAAIFASSHAARNVGLAAHLAFETRVSATEAIKMMQLSAGGASSKTLLDQRMQSLSAPRLGQDAQHKHASSTADQMKAVYNRVKGKK